MDEEDDEPCGLRGETHIRCDICAEVAVSILLYGIDNTQKSYAVLLGDISYMIFEERRGMTCWMRASRLPIAIFDFRWARSPAGGHALCDTPGERHFRATQGAQYINTLSAAELIF